MTLSLPPNLEERLQHEAERQGISADTLALRLLDQNLPSKPAREELAKLLQSWIEEGDAQEQEETREYLTEDLGSRWSSDSSGNRVRGSVGDGPSV